MLCLLIMALVPWLEQPLPQRYYRLDRHDRLVYAAPRFGRSVLALSDQGQRTVFQLTDNADLAFDDFQAAPFALFINTGRVLIRHELNAGRRDTLIRAAAISAFAMVADDDLALADQNGHQLRFLDFRGQPLFSIGLNTAIKDLAWACGILYALTETAIIGYDRFGNQTAEIPLPASLDRLCAADSLLFLFKTGARYGYFYDEGWQRFEVTYAISDMAGDETTVVILGNFGTRLYYYHYRDFGAR